MENIPHIPVLFNEVIDVFKDISEGSVVDCTLGYAGHSSLILENNQNITLYGIDQDAYAIAFSTKRLEPFKERATVLKGRFSDAIKEVDITSVKGVLADIGVSSLQLDNIDRGFSFNSQTLDMRMNQESELDAYYVINHYDQEQLEFVFREYGEMRNAKKVAQTLVQARLKKSIETPQELVESVKHLLPRGKKINPATLLFQAIRIEVNDELGELKRLLAHLASSGLKGCKVAIISFHSLEDRIIKNLFKEWAKSCICPADAFRCTCGNNHAKGKILTKKPIIATATEIKENPRSRSAKMRVFYFE